MPPAFFFPQIARTSSTLLRPISQLHRQNIRTLTTSPALFKSLQGKTTKIDMTGKNPGNVVGGYKATISDPHRSEEAKAQARAVLDEHFGGGEGTGGRDADGPGHHVGGAGPTAHRTGGTTNRNNDTISDHTSTTSKNLGNVVGGYKATLSNSHIGTGAKAKAKAKLNEMGVEVEDD